MKKKLVINIVTLLLAICFIAIPTQEVKASELPSVDGSILTDDNESVGEAVSMTRGVYYQTGNAQIVKSGSGLISCNGTTVANRSCTVSVNVIVERLVGGSWARVTSWTATNNNSTYVSSTKTISVGSGYYYRTRCIHYAASDVGNSYTNGIYI